MNTLIEKDQKIENLIYEIRGKQVMLDSDLAKLYQCKNGTKEINQAVRNNPEKFPERFSFKLTDEELNTLRSKILTTKYSNMTRTTPRVFTEQGVSMLATILKTKVATKVSIRIMDAFVAMKSYISDSLINQKYINNLVIEHEERLKLVEDTFKKLEEQKDHIFYKGQIYDAYSALLDILDKSEKEIIIIDNYVNKKLLDILAKTKKEVIIITNKYDLIDYEKYKKQYNNVRLKINNDIHDRFIIIDKKTLYHSGASFKDLGKKMFCYNKNNKERILKWFN